MSEKSIEELEKEIKSLRENMKRVRANGDPWDVFPIPLLIDMLERDLKERKKVQE